MSGGPGRQLRLALAGLSALFIASGVFAVVTRTDGAQAQDMPILRASVTATAPPPTTSTELTTTAPQAAPPSATAPPSPATARPTSPVPVPREEYAPEPVQEIGIMEIPKIALRHRIMNGITMRNIDLGPSHWPGTAIRARSGTPSSPGIG